MVDEREWEESDRGCLRHCPSPAVQVSVVTAVEEPSVPLSQLRWLRLPRQRLSYSTRACKPFGPSCCHGTKQTTPHSFEVSRCVLREQAGVNQVNIHAVGNNKRSIKEKEKESSGRLRHQFFSLFFFFFYCTWKLWKCSLVYACSTGKIKQSRQQQMNETKKRKKREK